MPDIRTLPGPITWRTDLERGVEHRTVQLKVITPLFGGGVHIPADTPHIKVPDHVSPIRGSSIRGQLRFWWRAAHGCQLSLTKMREAEARIWGEAADQDKGTGPGRVALQIIGQPTVRPVHGVQEQGGDKVPLGRQYGAFPLRPGDKVQGAKTPGKLHQLDGAVQLRLVLRGLSPEETAGVDHALAAWLAFGGLGGRVRRGFGAVHRDGQPQPRALLETLAHALTNTAKVPSLSGARLAIRTTRKDTALDALDAGLDRLRAFRQGPGIGRNPGSPMPGRSFWPEADEIRRLTGQSAPSHRTPFTQTRAFPRAAFGLPIIFHFKTHGDPSETTLVPQSRGGKKLNRFASPLIIRPFRREDGKYDVLALTLGGPGPGPVLLEGAGVEVTTEINRGEAAADKMARALQGNPDVLAAFLHFFSQP